jgi:hypothetical protein
VHHRRGRAHYHHRPARGPPGRRPARQTDPDWFADYHATRLKVERKIGHLTWREPGGRRARMRGTHRIDADVRLLASAINLARLAALGVHSNVSDGQPPDLICAPHVSDHQAPAPLSSHARQRQPHGVASGQHTSHHDTSRSRLHDSGHGRFTPAT